MTTPQEETALRAQVARLREELRKYFPCGRISHDRMTCEREPGHSGFHATTDGAQCNWPDSEGVGWDALPAALADTDSNEKWLAEHDDEVAGLAVGKAKATMLRELESGAFVAHDTRVRADARRAALDEAAKLVETQVGDFTRNEADILHALAEVIRYLKEQP